jgi:hypothetical protein
LSEWKSCPDFDLAKLSEFDPKIFDWDTKDKDLRDFYAFIITLGLVYNDFKDLAWWQKQLDQAPPKKDEVSTYFGQWNGMSIHVSRLTLGLYREFLKMVRENSKVLEGEAFCTVLKKVSARHREDWKKIVKESTDDELLSVLEELRSNIAFHYANTRGIFNGYKNAFKDSKELQKQKCYFSLGNNILSTRFYFSDAAVRGYADKFNDKKIEYLLMEMNTSVRRIVSEGINHCLELSKR